jgi:NitT/TauT family transport system ATP-binding protein
VFRSDLYRIAMQRTGADLPGASEKVEGGIDARQPAASEGGTLYLEPNMFFDRVVFDPGPHS